MIHYQPQLKAILSIQTQVLKVFIINNSGKPNWLGKMWEGKQIAGIVDWWVYDASSVCSKS